MSQSVWVDRTVAGYLDRDQDGSYYYAYERDLAASHAVSLTMPVEQTVQSYHRGLHPVFQMNLPEGRLREVIERKFRKAAGSFDDLDLLNITGPSQIGRLRYGDVSSLDGAKFISHSVNDILTYRGTKDLFVALLDQYATNSGISGVQPKVLIRDENISGDGRRSLTVRGATHIVKTWDQNEYPEMAANEYFCLLVAKQAGLRVPEVSLSDGGRFLVVTRFDMGHAPDGRYLGFEDFCVLHGLPTDDKYSFSYESVAKRVKQFVSPEYQAGALKELFLMIAVSCAVQNGDAHLKNFGVLYEDAEALVRLAPAYDIVTTSVYMPNDTMALLLDGRKSFPSAKVLVRFAQTQCNLQPREAMELLERVSDAVQSVRPKVMEYAREYPQFREVGEKMLFAWNAGLGKSMSLKGLKRPAMSVSAAEFGV